MLHAKYYKKRNEGSSGDVEVRSVWSNEINKTRPIFAERATLLWKVPNSSDIFQQLLFRMSQESRK